MGQELTIGIAVPDLSEYVALDPSWSIGDPEQQCIAAVERCRDDGRIPIHGRDVRLVFASYRSNQPAEKVAAARRLAEADAFAVLGGRDFTDGARRLAAAGVPVIDVNAVPSATLQEDAPWLFTLRPAQDVLYRSFVAWAHAGGHLDGRVIGIFCDRLTRQSSAAAIDELNRLGHDVRTLIDSDGIGVGSEHDESAPARFAAEGVDLLLGFVGGSSWINTLRAAEGIGYRPNLLDLETGEHTNDVTARRLPPELYDGTLALTMSRVGDLAAGRPLGAETVAALEAYERWSGRPAATVATMTVRGVVERAHHERSRDAARRGTANCRSRPESRLVRGRARAASLDTNGQRCRRDVPTMASTGDSARRARFAGTPTVARGRPSPTSTGR